MNRELAHELAKTGIVVTITGIIIALIIGAVFVYHHWYTGVMLLAPAYIVLAFALRRFNTSRKRLEP